MKTVQIVKNVKVQKNNLVVGDYIKSDLNDTQYNFVSFCKFTLIICLFTF